MKKDDVVINVMTQIKAIEEYKGKYGEDDILEYYNIHGSYRGIEKYLSERATQRQTQGNKLL